MGTQHPSVPPHAQSRIAADKDPKRGHHTGGLVHDNTRHTTRFTVIGNHLAQHRALSLLAIGLAVHLQSLPRGARVTTRKPPRTPDRPAAPPKREKCEKQAARETGGAREKRAARKPLPAVPRPAYPAPALLKAATDLLADLRRHDSRLLLSACDTAHLAPGVAAWLEREVGPAAVRHALIADLPPEGLRHPAAVLAHRLTAQLPPPLPFRAPAAPLPVRHPLQTCEGCDRAFRAPEPGRCRDCRTHLQEDA
ncbi:helix-turn-helix domain-containing protein [Streptomyces sp. NPDC014889]|uniref:helix-turn-helix domain-containing protein n=1 Tax=Streptomyces sp. NPDC014889 TaxID=3364928 RepID=UPI0036F56724